jgi:hypothetical protein
VRFDTSEKASAFFDAYHQALLKKYPNRTPIADAKNDLEFSAQSGAVFFRCQSQDCITAEGADQKIYFQWLKKLSW